MRYTFTSKFKSRIPSVIEDELTSIGALVSVEYGDIDIAFREEQYYDITKSPYISFSMTNFNFNREVFFNGEYVNFIELIKDNLHDGETVSVVTISGIEMGYMLSVMYIAEGEVHTKVVRGLSAKKMIFALKDELKYNNGSWEDIICSI